jgi:protein-arginine kinase activator protein McsA
MSSRKARLAPATYAIVMAHTATERPLGFRACTNGARLTLHIASSRMYGHHVRRSQAPPSPAHTEGQWHMRIEVTCPSCDARWQSQTTSGRTRCGRCRKSIYVPVAKRREPMRNMAHTAASRHRGAPVHKPEHTADHRPRPEAKPRAHRPQAGPDLFELAASIGDRLIHGLKVDASSTPSTPSDPRTPRLAPQRPSVVASAPGASGHCPQCTTGTSQCPLPDCPMPG